MYIYLLQYRCIVNTGCLYIVQYSLLDNFPHFGYSDNDTLPARGYHC